MNNLLNKFMIEEQVKSALKEDIGYGDITTDFLIEEKAYSSITLRTRQDGILCGCEVFKTVFDILGGVEVNFLKKDGDKIVKNEVIANISGNAKSILKGERLALNFIQKMSGIATETGKYVEILKEYKSKITDTRKNTPNFRIFEKYAVLTGGASLHRFNLSDCVMIKDNHIAFCGSITKAVEKIKKTLSHTHKIEIECDSIEQVKEALENKVDIIMLDNMSCDLMKKCVELIADKSIIEASGQVTKDTLEDIAKTGVDYISTSAIVFKAF